MTYFSKPREGKRVQMARPGVSLREVWPSYVNEVMTHGFQSCVFGGLGFHVAELQASVMVGNLGNFGLMCPLDGTG